MSAATIDYKAMTIPELRQVMVEAEEAIHAKQEAGRSELIARLTHEAEALGYDSIEHLVDRRRRSKRRGNGTAHATE